jgi:hypothetical protein
MRDARRSMREIGSFAAFSDGSGEAMFVTDSLEVVEGLVKTPANTGTWREGGR